MQAVVFSIGGDEYALPIGQVREVIAYTEPRSIASRVSWVRGVINLRGTILPVCDLAARLGRRTRGEADKTRIIVVGGRTARRGSSSATCARSSRSRRSSSITSR
jgi:purine-binding chemotaxis protein CheW